MEEEVAVHEESSAGLSARLILLFSFDGLRFPPAVWALFHSPPPPPSAIVDAAPLAAPAVKMNKGRPRRIDK